LTLPSGFPKVPPTVRMKLCNSISLAALCFSAALAARGETVDAIQAIVGDSVITLMQIERATLPIEEEISQQATLQTESETRSKIIALRQNAFNSFVDDHVILQEFKRLEKDKGAKIPDSYVDQQVQAIIRDKFGGDRVRFDKELEAEGKTHEQFRQEQRDAIIVGFLTQQFVTDPIISPLKIETYYRQHQDQFTVPARIKFRWICMDKSEDDTNGVTREKMNEVLSQIKDGADFGDLARTYSQRPQRDADWLEIATLNEAFRDEVAKLKPGQSTGVIETPQGFFLLHVDDLDPAHVSPLNDVRAGIGKTLLTQERNRRRDAWIKRLKSKTLVLEF
jgi:peptidyl-prolyl cis-trans isomerase SurA